MIEITTTNNVPEGISRLKAFLEKQQKEALLSVGKEVLADIDNVEPKIPVNTGDLRDSGYVKQENKEVKIGFTADYALKVHENVGKDIQWTRAGSGPQFVYAKLANQNLRKKYGELMAKIMKLKG